MSQMGHFYFGAVGQFYIGANTLQMVRRNVVLQPARGVSRKPAALAPGLQVRHLHQARHAVDTALLAGGPEVVPYPRAAIGAVAQLEAFPNTACEPCIGLAVLAGRPAEPSMEPAGRDVHRPVRDPRGPHVAMANG